MIVATTRLGLRRTGERRASDAWETAFVVAASLGVLLGLFGAIVEWTPSPGSLYTSFPLPIGVIVELEDGSFDCGTAGDLIPFFLLIDVRVGAAVVVVPVWFALVLRSTSRMET